MSGAASSRGAVRRCPRFLTWSLVALVVAAGLYFASQETSTAALRRYTTQVVEQAAGNLRAELDKYESISFQFISNRDLNRLLTDYVGAADAYDVSAYNQRFSNYLEGYAFNDTSIYDALFVDEADGGRKPLTMGESLPYGFVRSFRKSQLFREIVRADGRPVWSGPLRPTRSGRYCVALGRRIKHLFTGRPLGVLVILLKQERLAATVNDYLKANFYFSVGTPRSSHTLIADDRGLIVSAALEGSPGQTVGEVIRHAPPNRSVLAVRHGIAGTRWHVVVPVSLALRGGLPGNSRRLLLVFLAVAGLLAAGVAVGRRGQVPVPSPRSAARAHPEWLDALNAREREILALLAQGYSNREIAERIFVAEQTVKNYVSSIYCKIGVRDRVQASLKAVEAGLHLERY